MYQSDLLPEKEELSKVSGVILDHPVSLRDDSKFHADEGRSDVHLTLIPPVCSSLPLKPLMANTVLLAGSPKVIFLLTDAALRFPETCDKTFTLSIHTPSTLLRAEN